TPGGIRMSYMVVLESRREAWMIPAILNLVEREHGVAPPLDNTDLIRSHLYVITNAGDCVPNFSPRAMAIRDIERRKHEAARRKRDKELSKLRPAERQRTPTHTDQEMAILKELWRCE
ncbi:hypothetical protein, partial [Rhodococcus sp. HS-D2]|uniref:hypothetical protein n=1 Tax=Rhodococcus sp. HS-D2 TaxID=1384636 RepID=UPI001E2F9360